MASADSGEYLSSTVYLPGYDMQKGQLTLSNGKLIATDEQSHIVFSCNVDDVTKATTDGSVFLNLYGQKGLLIKVCIGDIRDYIGHMNAMSNLVLAINQIRHEKQMRPEVDAWLDYFDSRGILKRTRVSMNGARVLGIVIFICIFLGLIIYGKATSKL